MNTLVYIGADALVSINDRCLKKGDIVSSEKGGDVLTDQAVIDALSKRPDFKPQQQKKGK